MPPLQLDSADDLESLALELGGSATHKNGRVFNASGRTGVRRMPTPAPVAEKPAPPPVDPNAALMAKVIELLARPAPQPPTLPPPVVPAPQVVISPAARVSWTFDFVRNNDGTIKSITATPKG